jgi:hypothetical protein
MRTEKDTTALRLLAAYDALVAKTAEDATESGRLRDAYQRRTGTFGPEDAWFEARSRALWDDVVTSPGFAYARSHRGFFVVAEADADDIGDGDTLLVDLWSGAELFVRHLDEAQALALDHAEGPIDARVLAAGDPPALYVLPGAYHHAADALEPATNVLGGARDRGMGTTEALDALMRMDLVFRSSSRVKASFAYKVEALSRPR